MSAVVRFNPSPRTFQARTIDGKWAQKPVRGIVSNRPESPVKSILSQHPVAPQPERKIYP